VTPADWREFLGGWSAEVIASGLAEALSAEARESGWLGQPGAAESDLVATEARLGKSLPPSYRAFLTTTDGWPTVAPLLGWLWPAEHVAWLADRRPGLIADYGAAAGLVGDLDLEGSEPDPTVVDPAELGGTLEISDLDPGDGAIYLLNPAVVSAADEWEAWYFAWWLPGAIRYPCFGDLMVGEHRRWREVASNLAHPSSEFVAHVRARLRLPGDEPEPISLPALIEALEREITRRRARMEPAPDRSLTLPGYQESAIRTLRMALRRVRRLDEKGLDPAVVRTRLEALADELEALGRAGMAAAMREFSPSRLLVAMMLDRAHGTAEQMNKQLAVSGEAAGHYDAARIVRLFLAGGGDPSL
jgi:hypothetical protein